MRLFKSSDFEDAVIGMKKGQEKEIRLTPEQSYGDHNPDLIKEIPRDKLPNQPEPQVGMFLALRLPDGMQLPAKIIEVKEDIIKLDLNHPLAGKNLNFKIKLLEIT